MRTHPSTANGRYYSYTQQHYIIPEVVSSDPGQEVTVSIICTNPPFILTKIMPFAQMYVLNGQDYLDHYDIYLSHVLGREKPKVCIAMSYKEKTLSITGMADTGADITLIPQSKWPDNWKLVSPSGTISGIRGAVTSLGSKNQCGMARGTNCDSVSFYTKQHHIIGQRCFVPVGARLEILQPTWDF